MANAKVWRLNRNEMATCYGVGSPTEHKCHFPKLMPMIAMGETPKATKHPLQKSLIINAKPCKPNIAKKVNELNYMTIPCDETVNGSELEKYQKVMLKIRNGSPDQLLIIPPET